MSRKFDYIIVGQGLAGSMFYHSLVKRGKNIFVIDKFNATSSSNVAPGIIHPITGRRIVKSWLADTLFPFAEETYREIEKEFDEQLFFRTNILELIHSVKEQNDWSIKSSLPEMRNYFSGENTDDLYNDVLVDQPKKISISMSGWLHVTKLISLIRQQIITNNLLLNENFDSNQLELLPDGVVYKNIEADKIIFCEGYRALQNPYWKHLPFLPAKGEVLTIRSEQLQLNHILIKAMFILPIGDHLFKVGATYSWDNVNEVPTEKAKEDLLNQLHKVINVPYEVVDHKASVRPTVKDRRPFIGFHHMHQHVGILNGLGTKGVLLSPYFSNHFAEYLSGKTELMKEVNVNRFAGISHSSN